MKKLCLSCIALFLTASNAVADVIGAKAGYDFWLTNQYGNAHSAYVQLEHPIPFVPDVAFKATRLNNNKTLNYTSYDLLGYFEILDNGIVSLDVGAGLRMIGSGKIHDEKFTDTMAMVYIDAEALPDETLSFYGKLDAGKNHRTNMFDAVVGARYNIFPAVYLQAGYRYNRIDIGNVNTADNKKSIHGPQVGLHIDI